MTTKNDSNYFAENPQYHMFLHPEFPSYEEQMAARDRMLDKNPGLVFIGCHLASLEWSVDELGKWLDKYPNTAVDMAARMGQLFYQTRDNREKVRDFFHQIPGQNFIWNRHYRPRSGKGIVSKPDARNLAQRLGIFGNQP
jgi:hypothetical protein